MNYEQASDFDLIGRISTGDELAFDEIYHRFKGVLYVHAVKMIGNQEEAKDIIQEIFIHIWTNRESLSINSTVSGYLYSIVKNKILLIFAHKKVEQRYVSSLSQFLAEGSYITDEQVREHELSQLIEKEVAELPNRMRKVFELSRDRNLSYKEIALEMNISDNTVKKQLSSALKILRTKLDLVGLLFFFAN